MRTPRKNIGHTRKQNLDCLTCAQCGVRTHTRHSSEIKSNITDAIIKRRFTKNFTKVKNKQTKNNKKHVGNDQEMAQLGINSHSTNRGVGKNKNDIVK